MSLKSVYTAFSASKECISLSRLLSDSNGNAGESISVRGLSGSLPAFLVARIWENRARPLLCLFSEAESAAYFHSDIQQILRRESDILLFPASDRRPYDPEHVANPAPAILRADILQQLDPSFKGILVTDADAIVERIPPKSHVEKQTIDLTTGSTVDLIELIDRLVGQGFTRVEFVEQPGELALRGGILDVFPFTGDFPVRVEFFGDEIDSIREFDIHTQLSVSRRSSARLVPNLEQQVLPSGTHIPLFDYLAEDALVVLFDDARLNERVDHVLDSARSAALHAEEADLDLPPLEEYFLDATEFRRLLREKSRLRIGTFLEEETGETIRFESSPQPAFNSSIKQLRSRLLDNHRREIRTIILCDNQGQEGRIHELLEDDMDRFQISVKLESLHEGFELPSLGIAVYTDHQIFNRYHRPSARRQKKRFGGLSLRELHQLVPGDFVVHIDHGIGRFSGMQKITVRGKRQEVARIDYLNDDVLYVNVNALHKLHKYKGKEGHQPKLTRLGSGQWERAKSRTKSRVKDIARDLIKLYARRKASEGYAFSEDSVWQRELEASFLFEDTPDQAAASQAVKEDMRRSTPMDRLVCGDVGFGKTEIAIRAAFKAVQDGKQVAVLVPTTVLAMQHQRTFTDRLSAYPVNVEVLSRFRSAAQITETISRIASGAADVIIGTHRLISKDVRFKDLGLLIVDEEQRFGVSVKEKLRRMRVNVDTLTLTATPIPRTLQFSLLGARDFSIMATAPPNRQPIVTEIHTFDKDLIRDAILLEVNRGGQVFFIHNRVQSIMEISEMIRMLIPDVRVQVGHGQMKGSDLERVMIGFFEKKFDVLVSTNIIENGLDVSNANTIIINRADYFGLSELHQLRGRVGRSARKAFCFLLVPSIHGLTREARQRLQAVEEFTDLGSGFHIAMQDLDIRGAGNLLGSEQSGFIEDVGFETYHRILDEAVQELRAEEFSDLFDEKKAPVAKETSIDVEADAFIPQTYLANRIERLNLYRRIADARNAEALDSVRAEMADRFGPVPEEVENLLLSVEIKLLGQNLRLSRVVFKNHRLFLVFPTAEADAYFFEHLFHGILERLNGMDRIYALKENSAKKLRAIVQNVPDLDTARDVLLSLQVKTGD